MKKFTAILLTVLMIAGLFISCENKITPVSDETVSVSFDESTSRSLTASLEEFNKNNYLWKYAARKNTTDGTGLNSGVTVTYNEAGALWINGVDAEDNRIKGLGSVAGFSQGIWDFKLFAYKLVNSTPKLAYEGEIIGVSLKKGNSNIVTVTVSPVAGDKGTLILADTITLIPAKNTDTPTELTKVYTVSKLGSTDSISPDNNKTDQWTLDAGAYKVNVDFVKDGFTYASGSVVATVYSNITTTVDGNLAELVTKAEFDSSRNPDIMNMEVSSGSIDFGTLTNSSDVTISSGASSKVSATVPASAATQIVKSVAGNNASSNTTIDLALRVDTVAATNSTLELEISMQATVTEKDNANGVINQTIQNVTELKDSNANPVISIVTVQLQKDLNNVVVKHNGILMNNLSSSTDGQGYSYDANTGILTIKTSSFSPFSITYDAPVYVAKIGNNYFASLKGAISAVESGQTITLLKDSAGDGIVVPSGKNFTVDFNSYTYDVNGDLVGSSGTETNSFQLLKDSTIVFKNGKLTSSISSYNSQILIQNYSNLTLDNMVVEAGVPFDYIVSNNNGNVVIKDTTITAAEGKVAFDVCRYSSYIGPKVTVEGNSVINGNVEISSSGAKEDAVHELVVTSGIFNGRIYKNGTSPNFVGNITGGTFSFDPSEYVANGYETKEENGKWIVSQIIVAKIGDSNYYSLEEAIDAATDGAEIILNSDISKDVSLEKYSCMEINTDKNIIINGNNHKIKLTGLFEDKTGPDIGTESYGIKIKGTDNKKTVTLKNLVIDTNNIQRAVRTEENIGVKFDNCKITTNGCGIHVKGANNVVIEGTDIIVNPIRNKFLAHLRSALMIGGANANVLLENSNISAINENKANMGDTNWYWSWCKGLYAGNSAKNSILTVSDTTVSADYSIAIDGTEDENNISKIIINSGSYNGIVRSPGGGSYKSIEITGGIFTGFSELNDFYGQTNSVARLVISGGTFPFAPDIKYIKNGYTVVDNGKNTWTVIENQTN